MACVVSCYLFSKFHPDSFVIALPCFLNVYMIKQSLSCLVVKRVNALSLSLSLCARVHMHLSLFVYAFMPVGVCKFTHGV